MQPRSSPTSLLPLRSSSSRAWCRCRRSSFPRGRATMLLSAFLTLSLDVEAPALKPPSLGTDDAGFVAPTLPSGALEDAGFDAVPPPSLVLVLFDANSP